MKGLLVVLLVGFTVLKVLGQPSTDVGIFGGTGTYFGDMTKIELSKSINPAYGGFVRYNFNPRYGLRFNVFNGTIGADGEFDTQFWEPDPTKKDWNFNKSVLDISLQFEFNFFKYIVGEKETPYSTYLFAGVGMQTYRYDSLAIATYSGTTVGDIGREYALTIPFGLGFKFNLSRRFGLGLEGGLRKSFSDKLDNLDDPLSYIDPNGVKIKYADLYHNNDWTAYVGIHLVYKMIYGPKQWELNTPKKKILDWGIENNSKNR